MNSSTSSIFIFFFNHVEGDFNPFSSFEKATLGVGVRNTISNSQPELLVKLSNYSTFFWEERFSKFSVNSE
jgi:hypothetical protein